MATSQGLAFLRVLFRWKGSVYKLLWKDLLGFLFLYYFFACLYTFALGPYGKRVFEKLVEYSAHYGTYIPLSFVLGFFVSNIMTRWWNQYQSIPWPTSIAVYVSSTLHGYDEMGRAMRRTVMRYVCLSLTMVLRVLSPTVQRRFPRMSDMITAGLLHENELTIIEDLDKKFPGIGKNFLPIVWAASIIIKARKEGRIRDDFAVKTVIDELNKFRGQCGTLMSYNSISIPLVYTQVVTIAVYTYFITALFAQQYVENSGKSPLDLIPFLIVLQFIFYMGWLKVAETLMNPFGEDDDDFEVSSMIDRNLVTSYLIVDEMHKDHPELLKDQYWNDTPQHLSDRTEDTIVVTKDTANYDVSSRLVSFLRRRSTRVSFRSRDREGSEDVESGESVDAEDKVRVTTRLRIIATASFPDQIHTNIGYCESGPEAKVVCCFRAFQERCRRPQRTNHSRAGDGRHQATRRQTCRVGECRTKAQDRIRLFSLQNYNFYSISIFLYIFYPKTSIFFPSTSVESFSDLLLSK